MGRPPWCGWLAAGTALALVLMMAEAQAGDRPGFFARLFGAEEKEEGPAFPVPDPVTYDVTFDFRGDTEDLGDRLKELSNLEKLKGDPPSGGIGLQRRAEGDRQQLIGALSAFGYYQPRVDITVAGVDVSSPQAPQRIDAIRTRGSVPVRVTVTFGPRFTFSRLAVVDEATGRPMAPPAGWTAAKLAPGEPAQSASVLAGERAIIAALREEGYAFAAVPRREAVVDHATRTMDVTFFVAPGRKARFGRVTVQGTERLDPSFVEERVPFKTGDLFSPEPLADLRRDLGEYDVFSSVRIREGEALDPDGTLPITIEVQERARRFIGFGAKYSTTEGPGINAYWGHRNLFGGAERLRLDAQVSGTDINTIGVTGRKAEWQDKLGYRFGATFTKPGIITAKDDLVVQATYLREVTESYSRQGFIGAIALKRRFTREWSGQIGLDIERAKYLRGYDTEFDTGRWYTLVGVPVQVDYDNTNDKLDPKRGIRASVTVEPFTSFLGSTVDMTMVKASLSGYWPIDAEERFVLAGRVGFGSLIGADLGDIPPPRRFYAGGGGSVRGYDYQSLGPKNVFGQPIGGRSLLEASAELRMKVTDTIGIVPFVDAGMAYRSSYPDFDEPMRYSAGIGLRYYTAIGPLRLDIARGLNRERGDPPFGLYISLGQAF